METKQGWASSYGILRSWRPAPARAWIRVLRSVCSALAITALMSCGPSDQTCSAFEMVQEYRLLPTVIEIDDEQVEASRTGCAGNPGLFVCGQSDGRYLTVSVRNRSDVPVVVRWNEAELEDEQHRSHRLVEFPDPLPEGELVAPKGQGFWQKLVPKEKRTLGRTADGVPYQEIEPFIPWESDPCRTRGPVDDFHQKGKEVSVMVPIVVGLQEKKVVFRMSLEAVGQEAFYRRLAASGGY